MHMSKSVLNISLYLYLVYYIWISYINNKLFIFIQVNKILYIYSWVWILAWYTVNTHRTLKSLMIGKKLLVWQLETAMGRLKQWVIKANINLVLLSVINITGVYYIWYDWMSI